LIDLPSSSYYRQSFLRREADKNLALLRLFGEEYTEHPFYGTRKMRDYRGGKNIMWIGNVFSAWCEKWGCSQWHPKPNTSMPHDKLMR
jgi:hypothetical protein